jgi:hypothetical protein
MIDIFYHFYINQLFSADAGMYRILYFYLLAKKMGKSTIKRTFNRPGCPNVKKNPYHQMPLKMQDWLFRLGLKAKRKCSGFRPPMPLAYVQGPPTQIDAFQTNIFS